MLAHREIPSLTLMIAALMVTFLSGLLAQRVRAEDEQRPQEIAATIDARANLEGSIGREMLSSKLSVADFLRRTGHSDDLARLLQGSQRVGGPRWLDPKTCQVELEISGTGVERVLLQIASSNPRTSPIRPEAMARSLSQWDRRTFGATGSSTACAPIDQLRPHGLNEAWSAVPDDGRQKALNAAKSDAINRTLDSIRSIDLGQHTQVGDALAVGIISKAMVDWLSAQPVTRVEFRRDLQVELVLSAGPEDMFKIFRNALAGAASAHLISEPENEQAWRRIHKEFVERMAPSVGSATVSVDALRQPARISLPAEAPEWVNQPLHADGSAPVQRSKLLSARAAEAAAREQLEQQIEAMPLIGALTLGQAARQDSHVRGAISLTVRNAPIDRTEYGSPGGNTTVHVSVDLHDLWEALQDPH